VLFCLFIQRLLITQNVISSKMKQNKTKKKKRKKKQYLLLKAHITIKEDLCVRGFWCTLL